MEVRQKHVKSDILNEIIPGNEQLQNYKYLISDVSFRGWKWIAMDINISVTVVTIVMGKVINGYITKENKIMISNPRMAHT